MAGGDVERGEQVGDAVALVVVGAPFDLAGPHRQGGLGAVQRLDAGLLVYAEHHGRSGGLRYLPTTSRTFSTNWGSSDSLNVSVSHGFSPNARQIRPTEEGDIPSFLARSRVDHVGYS